MVLTVSRNHALAVVGVSPVCLYRPCSLWPRLALPWCLAGVQPVYSQVSWIWKEIDVQVFFKCPFLVSVYTTNKNTCGQLQLLVHWKSFWSAAVILLLVLEMDRHKSRQTIEVKERRLEKLTPRQSVQISFQICSFTAILPTVIFLLQIWPFKGKFRMFLLWSMRLDTWDVFPQILRPL